MATKNVNAEAVQAEETEKKEAVNILDLLLGSDVGEIKLPTKEVEITRLSSQLRRLLQLSLRRYRI